MTLLTPTLLLIALVLGCSAGPEPTSRIVHRFVEPALRESATRDPVTLLLSDSEAFPSQRSDTARLPSATLGDDTRYILASHPHALVNYRRPATVEEGQEQLLRIPDALGDAAEVVVLAQIGSAERPWRTLPSVLRPVGTQGEVRFTTVDLHALGAGSGPAEFTVWATRPPGRRTSYRTPELDLPASARLEFALGVLEPARAEGPVRFVVDACRGDACQSLFDETLDPAEAPGWHDRSVSLAALADTRQSLRFVTEHVGGGGFSLPVWGDPTLLAEASARAARPNLILLSIDTLRRDHLDLYGHERETAPFLRERIAAQGVVFDDLVAEAATTGPSHMTIFSSLPALVHGVQCCMSPLSVPVSTLAQELRRHGLQTGAFTEGGPLARERGFSIGFDRWVENKSAGRLVPTGQVARTFSQARDWLRERGDRPFFLFLHTFQVHAPYEAPDEYQDFFAPEPTDTGGLETVRQYDREIRYVDAELEKLWTWMDGRGLLANTLLVILSDHGEEFYEHGSLGHATLPHEEVLRVPLVIAGPGVRPGARSPAPLRHVDLMPTILDLMGVPVPQGLSGRSFAAAAREEGAGLEDWGLTPVFSATWSLPDEMEAPALAVRLGDRKLIRYRRDGETHQELYDLARDPGERRNLAAEATEDVARLGALLDDYERAAETKRSALRSGKGPADAPVRLRPEQEEMLRLLGYLE